MKRNIFVSLVFVFMLQLTPFSASAAETQTVTLDVPGMVCAVCPITIHKALMQVSGVIDVKADLDTQTTVVTFDPTKTNIDTILNAIANAGYPATVKQ